MEPTVQALTDEELIELRELLAERRARSRRRTMVADLIQAARAIVAEHERQGQGAPKGTR